MAVALSFQLRDVGFLGAGWVVVNCLEILVLLALLENVSEEPRVIFLPCQRM